MSELVSEQIAALQPYQGGKPIEELAREQGLTNIVKLASNENPLGPSPEALKAAVAALSEVHRYPDASGYRLRSAIAEHNGVNIDEVIHGNGSNEIIELIVRTFMLPQHHIIFGQPAFSMYRVVAAAHNVQATPIDTDADLVHQLDAFLNAIRPETRVILIDNPNNPTGTYVPSTVLEKFLDRVPAHIIVVLDEAYFEYAEKEDYPHALKLRGRHENLVVLRTLSKAYGLAGFRVGYGIGPAQLISYMNRLRAPFNVGVVSQEAAIAAIKDQRHLQKCVELNRIERKKLELGLARIAVRVIPSQANFVLAEFAQAGAELYESLLKEGVIVRPLPNLPHFLRISVGTEFENSTALSALTRVVNQAS